MTPTERILERPDLGADVKRYEVDCPRSTRGEAEETACPFFSHSGQAA